MERLVWLPMNRTLPIIGVVLLILGVMVACTDLEVRFVRWFNWPFQHTQRGNQRGLPLISSDQPAKQIAAARRRTAAPDGLAASL